ncbi:MAG: cyanophycinase [Thermanaerothrix sp.]|uniref:cyanophycinase n=1 Tax=Thermanaerothrix sp. TaxID=2972675 RepID=UPI003C7C7DE9
MQSVVAIVMGGQISPVDECLAVFLSQVSDVGARVAILPTACDNPQVVQAYTRGLLELGLHRPPLILPIWERAQAEDRTLWRIFSQIDGLLILGGNVIRLLRVVRESQLRCILQQALVAGMVIAGISAGAAVLGDLVFVSDHPLSSNRRWQSGWGLLPRIVIVPHFRQRRRQKILMQLLMHYPTWLGVGVDEATAAVLSPKGIHATGSGQVTLMMANPLAPYLSGGSLPWAIHLQAGQSLAWDTLPIPSLPMIITRAGMLPTVTGTADIMLHFFKQ